MCVGDLGEWHQPDKASTENELAAIFRQPKRP
jgi:hypothetical protein